MNGEADNITTDPTTFGGYNAAALKALYAPYFQKVETEDGTGTSGLFANVDGQNVKKPYQYLQTSAKSFSFDLIEGGLIQNGTPEDAYLAEPKLAGTGTETPENPLAYPTIAELGGYGTARVGVAIATGYHLGIEVGAGAHTINFGGALVNEGSPFFSLDITYNILNPVEGTKNDNTLAGTGKNDYITGKNGADKLQGLGGDDLILGGKQADTLDGGTGNDELWGNQGVDKYIFALGSGQDKIFGFAAGEVVKLSGFGETEGVKSIIELPSGISAVQVTFGESDSMTFVGYDNADIFNVETTRITIAAA